MQRDDIHGIGDRIEMSVEIGLAAKVDLQGISCVSACFAGLQIASAQQRLNYLLLGRHGVPID